MILSNISPLNMETKFNSSYKVSNKSSAEKISDLNYSNSLGVQEEENMEDKLK
jgi:hypothetical protein